jgi:glutathione peroxidase-family protein
MATQNTNRRLRPEAIVQGNTALSGLRTMTDYNPIRYEASLEAMQKAQADMLKAQELEVQLKAQYRAASDEARLAEWNFYNCVLAVKTSVVAQYGPDSNQAQTIGLKKKSAYKRPVRQKKAETAPV